ncbi:MAG: MFS transporter [Cocleimonas sp.]
MKQTLKFSQIFIYGLPGFPLAMLGLPLFVYLPSYYSQNLGLSLSAVGFALLLARSFDVITDPLIGLLNDRYPKSQSVLWRRKCFMIIGVPLLLLGLNFLLRPNDEISTMYLFTWSFITYLGWTLINIPWLAIGAEISHDYHEKSALASSREIFSVIGTVAVISIPILLSIDLDLKTTLETLANLLTVFLPLALIPLFLNLSSNTSITKNKISQTRQNNHQSGTKQSNNKQKLFSKESFEILKHPAIRKLLPAYFLNSIANALPATLFILFVSFVLQAPEQVSILLSGYFLSAIVGIPLWLYIARKTDKHISWCIALLGSIISFMWVPFIGEGNVQAFMIICLVSGFCLGADVVMPASIQADIAQDISQSSQESTSFLKSQIDSHKEPHQESTAMLFGIWGLLTKLSLALAVGIAFPILDILGLNVDAVDTQINSTTATTTLIILYALIPVIIKIWVLIQMWSFPFGKQYFSSQSSFTETNFPEGNKNEYSKTSNTSHPISLTSSYKRLQ